MPADLTICSNNYCTSRLNGSNEVCIEVAARDVRGVAKAIRLCSACKANFDQNKYCPHCFQIYGEKEEDNFDGKDWVGCDNDTCKRWVHVACERKVANLVVNTRRHYLCPLCRKDHKGKNGSGNGEDGKSSYNDKSGAAKSGVASQRVRRTLRVDLSRLELASLRRYKRAYKLRDVMGLAKDDLVPAVTKHFTSQVVDEDDTLYSFAICIRRHSHGQAGMSQGGGTGGARTRPTR